MSTHYPYTSPKLFNNRAQQWIDWTEDGYYWNDAFELVSVNDFTPKEWKPAKTEALLEKLKAGQSLDPVRITFDNGRYSISDGNHRVTVSKKLGFTHVPAIVSRKIVTPPEGGEPPGVQKLLTERELMFFLTQLRNHASHEVNYSWGKVEKDSYTIDIESGFPDERRFKLMVTMHGKWRKAVLTENGEELLTKSYAETDREKFADTLNNYMETVMKNVVAKELVKVARLLTRNISNRWLEI